MYRFFFKRVLDIIVSLIALPFVLVISLILSVVIFFNDGGTPFYFAERLGKNGKVFKMYKLRTMKKNMPDLRNPDGSTYNSEDDYRLTSCGKWIRRFSLDELPQVLNVLKGEMSLVGPRPDLPSQEKFYVGNERDKLLVRPGITGYPIRSQTRGHYPSRHGRNSPSVLPRVQSAHGTCRPHPRLRSASAAPFPDSAPCGTARR